jgi:hypothetical protein
MAFMGFSSCSTLTKQAKEQLENKNYDEALILYDRLVSEKPNEGEALEGQRKSREGVIDKNLIRVRLARLGQNYQESLDLLREIVIKERQWNLYPSGAVAFTQSEETTEAKNILNAQLHSIQKEKKPLKSLYWIERYRTIFDEKYQVYLGNFKNSAYQEGEVQCKAWTKTVSAEFPFWSQFVKRFCTTMKVESKFADFDKKLFLKADVFSEKTFMPIPLQQMIASDVSKVFNSTGWYDPAAKKKLTLTLNGNYRFDESKVRERRVHSYNVSVPYTEYVEHDRVDSTGKSYKVSEPVTKYRDEQRQYGYFGILIDQRIDFDSNLKPDILAINSFHFSFNKVAEDFVHTENIPSMKLYPMEPDKTKSEPRWLVQISNDFSLELKKSLIADFKHNFCDSLSESMNSNTLSDRSLLCLRETLPSPVAVTERHFQDKFGLTVAETGSLIHLLD